MPKLPIYHQQNGERNKSSRKHNTIQNLDAKPLINNHQQITQNISIEQ
jgi:hypothetical protein